MTYVYPDRFLRVGSEKFTCELMGGKFALQHHFSPYTSPLLFNSEPT